MRILSININDFGGLENHLMEHKKYNAWVGRECIDWKLKPLVKWLMIGCHLSL